MELPFVYIDPQEENADIASVGEFLSQARRVLSNEEVSSELKKNLFNLAMESIGNVKRYYQAKEREAQLTKKDAEYTEKLHQIEKELAVKESVNNELRSAIEKKKFGLKMAQMAIEISQERTRGLLRLRNELEEQNKQLKEQAERSSATWTASFKIACEQRERLKALMEHSPRIARQNNEREAVNELARRLQQLQLRKDQLQKEEGRLAKELEFQTATPLRVFIVNFARVMERTFEMRDKLKEARKTFEQLKAEEAERRRKLGPSEYDVFDASFMSQDVTIRKTSDTAYQAELPKKLLPPVQEVAADVSGGETTTNGSHSLARVEPPHTSCREVIEARTTAVRNYVEQQSESVASGLAPVMGDSDPDNATADVEERMSACEANIGTTEREDERMSVDGEEHETQDVSMNESVDEPNESLHSQHADGSDFSDDDAGLNANRGENGGDADIEGNATNEAKGAAAFPPIKESLHPESSKPSSAVPTQETASSKGLRRSQSSVQASQASHQSSVHSDAALIRQASTPKQKKAISHAPHIPPPSHGTVMTQESHSSISAIVNRQASPLTEDIPFSVSDKVGEDDFDPSAALNISAHSNDPGTDFLSLMESTNEKRASGRRSNSPDNEFSFSMFGAAADQVPSSGGSGGEFVFDFGNSTQEDDGGGDTSFHFNFDGPSDEQAGGKDEGFNLFGF